MLALLVESIPAAIVAVAPAGTSSTRPAFMVTLLVTWSPPDTTVRPDPDIVPFVHMLSPVTVSLPAPPSVPLRLNGPAIVESAASDSAAAGVIPRAPVDVTTRLLTDWPPEERVTLKPLMQTLSP